MYAPHYYKEVLEGISPAGCSYAKRSGRREAKDGCHEDGTTGCWKGGVEVALRMSAPKIDEVRQQQEPQCKELENFKILRQGARPVAIAEPANNDETAK